MGQNFLALLEAMVESQRVLREQNAASSHLKGKAREVSRDLPPHMANYAGLLFDGEEVLTSEVFNASPSSVVPEWRASPLPR
jgi:hypothetical protein